MFRQKKIIAIIALFLLLSIMLCIPVSGATVTQNQYGEKVIETNNLSDFLPVEYEGNLQYTTDYAKYFEGDMEQPMLVKTFWGSYYGEYGVFLNKDIIDVEYEMMYHFEMPLTACYWLSAKSGEVNDFNPSYISMHFLNANGTEIHWVTVDEKNASLTVGNNPLNLGTALYLKRFNFDFYVSGELLNEVSTIVIRAENSNKGYNCRFYLGLKKDDVFRITVGDFETDAIIDNQNKNAQSIIDHQTELQENEKAEANQTGADGVGEINSLIPNDTEGLTKAFSNLTKSMIHNNTTCKMNFPGVKIPKLNIRGFEFGNVTLLEEKEIDFEYYFTLIPEIYLKLIRALCTIALVVYCFKEMYSLLSFIFTAKGGGGSE